MTTQNLGFVVTTPNNSNTARVPLRGTIWAYDMDRAQVFATEEAALAALARAAKFSKAKVIKAARVEPVTVELAAAIAAAKSL